MTYITIGLLIYIYAFMMLWHMVLFFSSKLVTWVCPQTIIIHFQQNWYLYEILVFL